MRSNAKAYKQINSALPNDYLAKIFSYAGGGLIGWPIGAALSGGKPNWSLAGIGAGLIVVAIPIGKQCDKKLIMQSEFLTTELRQLHFEITENIACNLIVFLLTSYCLV